MNIKHIAASIAALTILAGAPALAVAQTASQGPVILNAAIQPDGGVYDHYVNGVISAAFTNTRNVPATDVIFELVSNGAPIDRISDVGTFASGTTIRHSFPDVYTVPDQKLTIAEVRFADGSVWHSTI